MDIVRRILSESPIRIDMKVPYNRKIKPSKKARKLQQLAYVAKTCKDWPNYWKATYYIGKESLDRKFAAEFDRHKITIARKVYVIFQDQKMLIKQT